MLRDRFGLTVATRDATTVEALDRFAGEMLSHGKRADVVLAAAAADPECALAQAYAAALFLCLQTLEGRTKAAPWLARAKEAAPRAGERERMVIAAIDAWARGEIARTVDRLVAICRRHPRDMLAAKLAQINQLSLGDRQGMRALGQHVLSANRDVGFAWGLAAFGLEQCGEVDAAEAHGRLATDMNPNDPWAHHAVVHALAGAGRVEEGLRWMEALAPSWDRCSSFMLTHNWWHTALLHIALGRPTQALALFDARVWGVRKTYVQDQVNAISLLSRLDMQGVGDTGRRWRDIADHVRPRLHDHVNGFLDLHFIYALARAGDGEAARAMLASMARHAAIVGGAGGALWASVAVPAARGLVAYAEGQPVIAGRWLAPILYRLGALGGSTAQQGWFQQIYFDCALRASTTRTTAPQPLPIGERSASEARRVRGSLQTRGASHQALRPAMTPPHPPRASRGSTSPRWGEVKSPRATVVAVAAS
ncbi:MAG TPA: tetratricopeptide repeat protein [Vineibacter sp.]|nr:tetratricopeptide repeat protein [Vineibacter sp.]